MSGPDRFPWGQGDVEVEHYWQPGDPIKLRQCVVVPGPDPVCAVHGLAYAEL